MRLFARSIAVFLALAIGAYSPHASAAENPQVATALRDARSKKLPVEERAALYLRAAAEAAPQLGSGREPTTAREIYNAAATELTVLLRSADGGRLWDRPLTLTAAGSTYKLRFDPGARHAVWAPHYFTQFVRASDVRLKIIKKNNRNMLDGVGGALVGVRKMNPPEPFTRPCGVTAPINAALDFRGNEATLTLRDPGQMPAARVAGAVRPLAGDLTAPLAYYPTVNETWTGLMGALSVNAYSGPSGLILDQPYDPDRIPLIFIHGLISTPQMWRRVVNAIEGEPDLRGRFQCWVFGYPTGNPVVYSALRLRQDLEQATQLYKMSQGVVLVSHSMGGLLAQMQATTIELHDWDKIEGNVADRLFSGLPRDTLIHRAYLFHANPQIRRIVFICTPHRGSDLAIGTIGDIAMHLVSMPGKLAGNFKNSMGDALQIASGYPHRMPNGITSLSPKSPPLLVMDKLPIHTTYHSIVGDRGKGNSPKSTDGVVAYWSSHLDSAESEKIVPGPHGSCELPETIAELKRILRLHLKTAGANSRLTVGHSTPVRVSAPRPPTHPPRQPAEQTNAARSANHDLALQPATP